MSRLARKDRTPLTTRLRRGVRRALTPAGLLLCIAAAQAQPPPPPPAPVVTVSRSWYVDAAITAVMMGLALFVVCRSSRRN